MKIRMDARQRSIAKAAVWTFTICLLIGIAVWRFNALVRVGEEILTVLAPIIIGLAFAYLLSPLVNWIEARLGKLTDRKKPHPRLKRALSVTLTMLIVFAAIIGLVAAIVPELISSIKNLLVNLPDYLSSITKWINNRISGLKDSQPQLYSALMSVWDTAQKNVNNFADQFEPKLDNIISGGGDFLSIVTTSAVSIVTWLKNILIGMVMTVYLLYNKERYLAQARKLLYATLPEARVHRFLRIGSHVSYTFMHFLSGKTLDSLIIGLLCFIGMTILNMPYVTLIAIIVGVTNIIPFFGPIIGAVPSGVLILLSEPRKVIPFVIFILVLQQFDGNILGPKILGDTLGLPMFWILFAIVVGGGMFGFIGMVAFVPLFAAMYALFSDFLKERLNKKGLPSEIDSYMTNEIHYADKPDEPPVAHDPEQEEAEAKTKAKETAEPDTEISGTAEPAEPHDNPEEDVPSQEEHTENENNS